MFFAIKDITSVYNSATGVPIREIFHQGLESIPGAIVLEMLIVLTGIGCMYACHNWQARLAWSFARDRGLPGSKYWAAVHPTLGVPLNAHSISCAIVAILGFLYIASSTAFNSMLSGCIVLLYISYSIPVFLLLFVKGRNNLIKGPFWMGTLGLISNVVLLLWTAFTFVLYAFPYSYPATAGNMNYVSALYAVLFMFLIGYWYLRCRKEFRSKDERSADAVQVTETVTHIHPI